MSSQQHEQPEAGRSAKSVRHNVRQEIPVWLRSALDAMPGKLEVEETGMPENYFGNFGDSVQDRIRHSVSEKAHLALPKTLAMKMALPLPAEIPNGATAYFRTLLARIKAQVELQEHADIPEWFVEAYDLMHEDVAEADAPAYTERVLSTLNAAIEDFELIPIWLEDALALRDVHVPSGYFQQLPTQLQHRIANINTDAPVSETLATALETVSPSIPEGEPAYFNRFTQRIKQRVEDVTVSSIPSWMDRALQQYAQPPIPGGMEAYFATFADQVKETVHELDYITFIETQDPTTVERLVEEPNHFQQLLDTARHQELPVGQELYFDDFSDRVRARIASRGLQTAPKNPVVVILHKQPVQWAVAACFGLLLGFIWFWKPNVIPVQAPPSKPQQEQVVKPKPNATLPDPGNTTPPQSGHE